MTAFRDHLPGKCNQRRLIRQIADEVIIRLPVDDANLRAATRKLLRNALPDPLRATRDDGNFILKHAHPTLNRPVQH